MRRPTYVVIEFLFSECVENPDLSRCPHGIVRLFATRDEAQAYVASMGEWAEKVAPHYLIVDAEDRARFVEVESE